MTHVRAARPGDAANCVAVLAALPEFFTPDTHQTLVDDLADGRTWVAEEGDKGVCGFVHANQRFPRAAEIIFAAVLPECRRRGIGQSLVTAALRELEDAGVAVVEAKALDVSAGYEPYEATRAFWESQGFVQVDLIDPLPGWELGNPSAIYVAALMRTTTAIADEH